MRIAGGDSQGSSILRFASLREDRVAAPSDRSARRTRRARYGNAARGPHHRSRTPRAAHPHRVRCDVERFARNSAICVICLASARH